MNSDFYDACLRHFDDAEQLFKAQRWANADHLFGISVECGLKRLMIAFGMSIDERGTPADRSDKVHADGVWMRYEAYRSGHHEAVHYVLSSTPPFHDWHINQRYAHQNNFDQTHVDPHRDAAHEVRKLLNRAERDGLL